MDYGQLVGRVKKIMHGNFVKGYSKSTKINFTYTRPSSDHYAFQYFWDTCFHTTILIALGDFVSAKEQLRSLFALQKENGFVGHIIYWNSFLPMRITDIFQSKPSLRWQLFNTHMSALIQPPLVARAVLKLYQKDKDINFLKQLFPCLKKYYHWIGRHRDISGDGLISIISPFESGMDWKPSFDEVVGFRHRRANWELFCRVVNVDLKNFFHNYNHDVIFQKNYFAVKETGINTIYAMNLHAMAELCDIMHDPEKEHFFTLANTVTHSIHKLMFDEETMAFYDLYAKNNQKIKVLTPTVFMPTVLRGIPDELCKKVLEKHLFNEKEFNLPFPIPSVALNDPAFYPKKSLYLWRGPVWIAYHWFIHDYLREKKYDEEAKKLSMSILRLLQISGFREYYNPFTGKGYGAKDFTWAGLILDMVSEQEADQYDIG